MSRKVSEVGMIDQEKIIERIYEAIDMGVCVDLFMDVLELLKEQEKRIKQFELERSWDENPDTMGKW